MINLVCGLLAIECRAYSTRADLLAYLNHQREHQLFGSSDDAKSFYSLSCKDFGQPSASTTSVGICAERHGLYPSILVRPERSMFLIGFDSSIVGISVLTMKPLFQNSLPALFWSFAGLPNPGLTLVLYETGAQVIGDDGKVIWDHHEDLVTNASVDAGILELRFSDSPPARMQVLTGEFVRPSSQ